MCYFAVNNFESRMTNKNIGSNKYRMVFASRSPYGERGLKSIIAAYNLMFDMSLSLRRAWIEMDWPQLGFLVHRSLSLRRAWIEMYMRVAYRWRSEVALLTESVD